VQISRGEIALACGKMYADENQSRRYIGEIVFHAFIRSRCEARVNRRGMFTVHLIFPKFPHSLSPHVGVRPF